MSLPRLSIGGKYVNMADIISPQAATARRCAATERTADATDPSPLRTDLIAFVELFFFAYRDFTGEPDAVLAEYDLGRAHHRVLHFVNRRPGLRVADLLDILKVTKQSLARVLKRLVDDGWIEQLSGTDDRRERRLYPTERGAGLAGRLARLQTQRVAAALAGADAAAVERFLLQIIAPMERERAAQVAGTPGLQR